MGQNQNLNGQISIWDFIINADKYWNRFCGFFIVWFLEILFVVIGLSSFGVDKNDWQTRLYLSLALGVVTFVMWLFSTKRLLFRSVGLVIFWLLLGIAGCLLYFFIVYPDNIVGSLLDLKYIQIWGSVIVFILMMLLGLFIDQYLIKGKKLLIVFAVRNNSIMLEAKLKPLIESIFRDLEDEDNDLQLIILPFGLLKSIKSSERYIKRPYTRADAVIIAKVIESIENDHVEYEFENFSSRINEYRFSDEESESLLHKDVVEVQSRGKTWNYINSANDNCSRTKVILDNLKDMLYMYIGGIYLMKHEFKKAQPYAEATINHERYNQKTFAIAAQLYTFSSISSAMVLENDDMNFDAAIQRLQTCALKLPTTISDPGFNKAMARLMFYKGDLKTSEAYTRKFKDMDGQKWGYELNMGIYAMREKKVLKFVQHYKKLIRLYSSEKGEDMFAIKFLERQRKLTDDVKYSCLLEVAIAYLYLYINIKKSKKRINSIKLTQFNSAEIKELDKLKTIVNTQPSTRSLIKK